MWNREIERAFIELKKAVTEGGIQAFPDFRVGDLLILTIDWSKENIAEVLSQVQDEQERFLRCWGRKYNKYMQNYPSYKGDLLAVIQCIKKLKHILRCCPFEVHTDASALNYMTYMKNQSCLLTRWYQELAGFNFTVIHKKGKENSNADAQSRSSNMVEAPPLAADEYVKFYEIDESVIQFEGGVNEIQLVQCSMIEITAEQPKDEVWSEVISWAFETGGLGTRSIWNQDGKTNLILFFFTLENKCKSIKRNAKSLQV